jgi:hypothetical protein
MYNGTLMILIRQIFLGRRYREAGGGCARNTTSVRKMQNAFKFWL